MTVQVGLDTNALRHLLDLGGEDVRLKLTQAAIQNFADRRFRISMDEATQTAINTAGRLVREEFMNHIHPDVLVEARAAAERVVEQLRAKWEKGFDVVMREALEKAVTAKVHEKWSDMVEAIRTQRT